MAKSLVVAEKYPVACDIAKVLHCTEKKDGYIEGERYIITWADGHLIGFQYPEEYNPAYKEWRVEDLPLKFDPEKNLKVLEGKEKQFDIVKRLIQGAETDRIINAGDAGREGYLLQYWIYKMAGNRKPVKVLWVSSLTEDAILQAFSNLHDESEFEGILEEAKTRAEMDYILGMNYSRLLTLKCSNDETLPYGRCMTTLLNLIVQREKEISAFESCKTYVVEIQTEDGIKGTLLDAEEKELVFATKKEAAEIIKEIEENTEGFVCSCKVKRTETKAPLLYSLPALQSAIGKKYKFPPERTLQIAQSLYEKKLISYPRTDACYLSSDLRNTIERNLECCRFGKFKAALERCEKLKPVDASYFNDEEITDHHALIPTDYRNMRLEYSKLSEDEKSVFDEIVYSFLGLFAKERVTTSVSAEVIINGYLFRMTDSAEEMPGFRLLRDMDDDKSSLPPFFEKIVNAVEKGGGQENMEVGLDSVKIRERVSSPPTRYNYGNITALMEEYHIGTPATMAETIHKLCDLKRPFLIEKSGKYYSTPFGRMYISVIPAALKDPEMSAQMEWKLSQIREGNLTREQVIDELMEELLNNISWAQFEKRSFGRCMQVKKSARANYKKVRRRRSLEW